MFNIMYFLYKFREIDNSNNDEKTNVFLQNLDDIQQAPIDSVQQQLNSQVHNVQNHLYIAFQLSQTDCDCNKKIMFLSTTAISNSLKYCIYV